MTCPSNIPFGVELETTMPVSDTTPIGGYHRGLPVQWLPSGWKAERDGSIRTIPNRKGCEFVSPILRGTDGLEQIQTACDSIKDRGGKVNASCGVHVTVTFDGDAAALARLVCLVANHEKALYASTGTTTREEGTYAKGLKSYGKDDAKSRLDRDRFHVLNLTHIARGRNRVEFRVFSGSLNPDKITAWVQICLALVSLATAQQRSTSWDYEAKAGKPGPWDRSGAGEGETELARLFYRIGWTKGHTSKTYGVIGEGVKAMKKTLRLMGRKYDAAAA